MSFRPELTFGVELEFLVAVLDPGVRDPEPTNTRPVYLTGNHPTLTKGAELAVRARVGEALSQVAISTVNTKKTEYEQPPCPDEEFPQEFFTKPRSWTIKTDESLEAPDKDYVWYPIEIVSPPLLYVGKHLEDVHKICEALTNNFRVNVNRSCGLHIHVGDGLDGFNHSTIKSLVACLWSFEQQLSLIHPLHRLQNEWSPGIDGQCALSREAERDGKTSRSACLDIIFGTKSTNDLLDLIGSTNYAFGAYNFAYLRTPYEQPTKRTVEFRYHEGTLDPRRVLNWLVVCQGLVKWAMYTPSEYVKQLCQEYADLPPNKVTLGQVYIR